MRETAADLEAAQAHLIDVHVGQCIRQRRKTLGLSQAALAEAIGLTFQQVQKYERGANRVSASVMWKIAGVLGCDPGDFFTGLPREGARTNDPDGFGAIGREFLAADGGLDLARAFLAMPREYRRALLASARALAETATSQPRKA